MARPMHVAFVSETWPPEVNGVALTVHGLHEALGAGGHRVSLVRPHPHDPTPAGRAELRVRGLPLPRYPGLRLGCCRPRQLLRHWAAEPPDAIYIATEGPLGWAALEAARRLRVPVASGFHTRFDQYMAGYGMGCLAGPALAWLRHFHNRASATLVPTRELAAFLHNRGFRHVERLPRAVDCSRFDPRHRSAVLRASWGIDDGGLAVVHVGRIAPEKNLELVVRAFRELQAQVPAARMVWVGDGPQRAAIARHNPDFVFVGSQRGAALAQHFASADLFLFASLTETFGNVVLEAMASGVPTVAFDAAAAREHLRDGTDGWVVPAGDAGGFIAAAGSLARDAALRRRMAAAARAAMLALDPARVAVDFAGLLARLEAPAP